MSYALLFSGQGTQHAGMFPWLETSQAARPLVDALDRSLGGPWRERLAQQNCGLSNALAQPIIVATSVAAAAALREHVSEAPEVIAGYSVGEIAACAAAGVYDGTAALALAQQRAALMDAAVAGEDTGLLAIRGVSEAEVRAACRDLECAIRIAPDNNVFGGLRSRLDAAQIALQDRAQFTRLCVALASHTSWMRAASDGWRAALATVPLRAPECALALNATGNTTRNARAAAEALVTQLTTTVRWDECMASVAERRPACVLEIGGGQSLARMWAAQHPHIPVRSLDEFRTLEAAASWVRRHSGC
jgi:[acyl-carrier-protein] S-malonyltransferase